MTAMEKSTLSPTRSTSASPPAVPREGSAGFRDAYYAYHLGKEVQRHHQRLLNAQAALYPKPNDAVAAGEWASPRLPYAGGAGSSGTATA